ncbi:MAG: histidine phosphatase family protein [bacterium]
MAKPPAGVTRVLLTRHGFSEHNRNTAVFQGRAPSSLLAPEGREQARLLGQRLAKGATIDRIVHSSLPRTRETAEIIAEIAAVTRLQPEDAFWDLSKGDWEGSMPIELPPALQRQMDADPFDFHYGAGESFRDVVARAAPAFDRWVGGGPGETLLFVVHADVIRAILFHLIGFPERRIADFEVGLCALFEFEIDPGLGRERCRVVLLNDTSHLE